MRRRVGSVDAANYPLLAKHVPAMANRSFMLRWQNGTQVSFERHFLAYVETVIAGLERMAAAGD